MNNIRSNMHKGNKHFVLGLSFVVFSLITSIYWSLIYADATTGSNLPSSPSNLVGNVYNSTVSLNWVDNASNEDKFNISRRLSGASSWESIYLLIGTDKTSYIDTSAVAGNSYDYKVEACLTDVGCSSSGAEALGVVIPPINVAPEIPSNFILYAALTPTMNAVPLKWVDNSNNEAYFSIERKLSSENLYTNIINTGMNVTIYEDSNNITRGLSYDYRIKACATDSLCSPYVNLLDISLPLASLNGYNISPNTITPSAPMNLRLSTTIAPGAIPLLWTNGTITQDSIRIQKRINSTISATATGANFWVSLPNLSGSTTSYNDSSVNVGSYYDYRIQACLVNICSEFIAIDKLSPYPDSNINNTNTNTNTNATSNPNLTTGNTNNTVLTIPSAPSGLRLYTPITSTNKYAALKWIDNSNNEDKFVIQRKLNKETVWNTLVQLSVSNITFFSDSSIIPGDTYDYRVQSCLSTIGCSGYTLLEKVSVPIFPTATTSLPKADISKAIIDTPKLNTTTTPVKIDKQTTTTNPKVPESKTTATTTKIPITTTNTKNAQNVIVPDKNDSFNTNNVSIIFNPQIPSDYVGAVTPTQIIENVTDKLNILVKAVDIKTDTGAEPLKNVIPDAKQLLVDQKAKTDITNLVYKDTNKDGISDFDSKYIYNLDPVKKSPVSILEGKILNAGDKILLGYDPTKKDLAKLVNEEPTAPTKSEITVSSYRVSEIKITNKKGIVLKGQALPNSFVTLYIYSTPIIVTVRTDSKGEWQYELDKELENGNHTVYTATVNNTGNIIAKSIPFSFIKTAEAVGVQEAPAIGVPTVPTEKPGFVDTKNIFIIVISGLTIIGIIFILIGLFSNKNTQ